MPSNPELLQQIENALKAFGTAPLLDASLGLFGTLGYRSERRMKLRSNTPDGFLGTFDRAKTLNPDRALLADWQSVEFLFQLTDAEVQSAAHGTEELAFDSKGKFDSAEINSFLFLAVELRAATAREGERKGQPYTRTELAGVTRALNRLFDMPAIVLFKHGLPTVLSAKASATAEGQAKAGDTVSLGIIHRRLSKRETSKDVLEKVTLIKDIAFADPIRAHVEILHDFALTQLVADYAVAHFVALHAAWQKRLGSYALSNDFYREIADWYFWAHHQVADGAIRLPQHCDTEQEKSLFLIRLLTRVIFSWFLVEKRLIPTDLFREHRLKALLKDFTPSRDPKKPDTAPTYYHAVLQNLFFGTLNMPADQRGFREKATKPGDYDKNFGITNLWRYEAAFRDSALWLKLAARVPFLNGGLFDCLDDKSGKKKDNFILDGFSDRKDFACHLPNDLFFGPERTVDLSRDYGEEDKRTARSKKARVRGLIEILSRYKFTIEENTPLEEEIALDPELLGKVFENLLASYNEDTRTTARKALGAFYTPREIVSYMVDEALKSYLATQVPRCKAALDDLFSNKATLRDIKPDTRDALIAAIGKVKILDPACGSGAFPMGALHRLVDLLQKLDPNNESWKRDRLAEARRYRALLESSHTGKEELAACDARIADIEKSFDTRYHALDFARKLYLIENSIYGVDIQPIATQIAKLRFFISLVVDQKVESAAPNLGVRPLPNLETRLVAADTLIPIEKAESDLFSGEIDRLRAELAGIRHEHFNARSPAAKRKWRDADAAKRSEIAGLLEREHAIPRDSARKLAAWDPYDQNTYAPFFDSEWMFGRTMTEATKPSEMRKDSGWFDIVLGNPPYVRQEKIKHLKDTFQALFKTFDGRADLLVYFYEAGIRLLRADGVLALITSNKFLRAGYGEPLRGFLTKQCQILSLVDFGDLPVFDATAYPCVFVGRKGEPTVEHALRTVRIETPAELEQFTDVVQSKSHKRLQSELTNEVWQMGNLAVTRVFSAIKTGRTCLKDVVSNRIYAGIKTGLNDAFIINDEQRRQLIKSHKNSAELIKPFLKGKDISKWSPDGYGRFVIYTQHGTDIAKYPAIREHLFPFKRDLEARALDQKWFELQQPQLAFSEAYSAPKIVYPNVALGCRFAWDESSYLDMTAFCIVTEDMALLPILNSTVMEFFFAQFGIERRGGYQEFKSQYVRELPVPNYTSSQASVLIVLTRHLIWLNRHFTDHPAEKTTRDPLMLAYWEQILNGLVYELYFLEELHAAGLRLFDLAAAADIPDLTQVPEHARLPKLRTLFETLHDGAHPLKVALQKLQTLDTIRIIEGKA